MKVIDNSLLITLILIITGCTSQNVVNPPLDPSKPKARSCQENFQSEAIVIPPAELKVISKKIYQNECAGEYKNLVTWNSGEDFPSLGIGHFIWYPTGITAPFTETFPKLIEYLRQKGTAIPPWLEPLEDAPWSSRVAFQKASDELISQRLRAFLAHTMDLQTSFIVERLNQSLPTLVCAVEASVQEKIRRNFYAVAQTPGGVYPLVDYINFKGEGTSEKERYQGQGWGLLQVLLEMEDVLQTKSNPRLAFAKAAEFVLERRVKNAPPERNEQQWLKGWKNRITTYR